MKTKQCFERGPAHLTGLAGGIGIDFDGAGDSGLFACSAGMNCHNKTEKGAKNGIR